MGKSSCHMLCHFLQATLSEPITCGKQDILGGHIVPLSTLILLHRKPGIGLGNFRLQPHGFA